MGKFGEFGGPNDSDLTAARRRHGRLAAVAVGGRFFLSLSGNSDLHEARELPRCFALGHGLHDLVLELPDHVVAHTKVALQLQRRHVGLAGRQQMHGQEPCRQWQSASFQYHPTGQRRLVAAGAALVVHPTGAAKPRAGALAARGAAKPVRPARPVQRPVALRLGSVLLDELRHRQPRLKLHLVHRHGSSP